MKNDPVSNYLGKTIMMCCFILLGGCTTSIESSPLLTRDYALQLAAMPKENYFDVGVYEGCETVPAKDPIKKRLLGFDITDNKCYVEVPPSPNGKNYKLVFRFIGSQDQADYDTIGPIEMTYNPRTDSFLGLMGEGDVFIAQYDARDKFLSFTHTVYDEDGVINYGLGGKGDYIRSCIFTQPTYLKGTDRCR